MRFIASVALSIPWALFAAQNVALLPQSDPAGYIARLLINEVPFPGERGYVSEEDSKAAMRALVLVLESRINRIPPGYSRKEIADIDSDNVLDIITAGGVRGQMDGFYYNQGRPALAVRVTKRVDNLLTIANKGEPGRFAILIKYAQGLASGYVNGSVPAPDLFASITWISQQKVTGSAYGWMTDKDYYHPGGCFVRIPNTMKGLLGGNRFYTLKQRKVSQPAGKEKVPVVICPGG